jgi:nucleoside-diphosphate-sugar epimerase
MAKVLVTGAAGYLGSIMCEHLLDAGHQVTGIDCLLYGQSPLFHLCSHPNFEFLRGDVRNETLVGRLVAQHDVIIPLAAIVGAPACDRDPLLANSVNHDAIRLINRLRSPSQLMIMPVSNSGYGTKTGAAICTEETPMEPISLYGRNKVDAENELLGSPNAISLRLATVFGMSPRMRLDLLVNHFVHCAVYDGYLVMFEKDFKRNFIHIRDVADAFLFAIANSNKMVGKAFNVGLDAANMSKEQLALKIKEQVPNFFLHCSEIGTDPDKRDYVVSNERLRKAGFEAKRSLEDGIRELIKGYRMLPLGIYRNA